MNKKRVFVLLFAFLSFNYALAQQQNASHSIRINKGYAYASDLGYEEEMKRSFQGMGYQYTTKSDWYIGTEVQFHHKKLNSNRLLPLEMQEDGTWYACRVPGGSNETGYFVVPQSMQTSVEVITNNNVYKSEMPKLPQTSQSLYASRLNIMMHGGRSWQVGAGSIEAGITFTGTFYIRDIVTSNRQQQAISCRSLSTGELYNTMFDVSRFSVVSEKTSWVGAGFHARYQYPVSEKLRLGMQLLGSMSVEGLLLKAAPYMGFGF